MLMLRRAQLEQELDMHRNQLLEVEARLRYIAREDTRPADDITVKKIPAMGVVAIAAPAPAYGPEHIVPVVNRSREQFDQLAIPGLARAAGPYMIFYEDDAGSDITVYLALPMAEPSAGLPAPAQYLTLPEVEAVVAVRSGLAASIFPMVYHDLVQWADAHGFQTSGPGREIWVSEVDDIAEADQQIFEIQLPFTRPEPSAA
jgi:effector-binding domain-containing protein